MLDTTHGERTSPIRELPPDEIEAVSGAGRAPFPLPVNRRLIEDRTTLFVNCG
jgi:hypothetical protein